MTSAAEDRRWMKLALTLGARGLGHVWPNPAVGCILVREGRVVGRGWTKEGGRPHAEVVALEMAGTAALGATAYVTLEPCAHVGKTGPCAEALVKAGVTRVVMGARDPDPRVNGQGIALLKAAGVEVVEDVCAHESAEAHAGFFKRIQEGRPFLTLKLAASLDGRIATASGHSQWITGPDARRHVHRMRATHDAVLVGAGTAREDLPSLTVRGLGDIPNPVRIVVSRGLDLPRSGPLAETARSSPLWLVHSPGANADHVDNWRALGAQCFEVATAPSDALDMRDVLQVCAREGLTRLLCEGGGRLAASLLRADCVDQFVLYLGGLTIGADGRPALGDLGLQGLGDAARFELMESRQIGADAMLRWSRCRS